MQLIYFFQRGFCSLEVKEIEEIEENHSSSYLTHAIHFYSWAKYSHISIYIPDQGSITTLMFDTGGKSFFLRKALQISKPLIYVKDKEFEVWRNEMSYSWVGSGKLKVKNFPWFSGLWHIPVCYGLSCAVAPKEISDRNAIKFHTPLGKPKPPFLP